VVQQQVSTAADQLVDVIEALHRRGWCDGTGGNFSLVLEREPLRLLMAPSGVDKGRVQADHLIQVNRDGAVISGSGKASAETLLHLRIVEDCQAGAVLHTHSLTATLLSNHHQKLGGIHLEGWEMLKGLAGVTTHDTSVQIPIIANHQNLQLLSPNAAEHLPNAARGLLVAGHGLYAWGESLETAQRHVEILEFLLNLQWRQQLLHLSHS